MDAQAKKRDPSFVTGTWVEINVLHPFKVQGLMIPTTDIMDITKFNPLRTTSSSNVLPVGYRPKQVQPQRYEYWVSSPPHSWGEIMDPDDGRYGPVGSGVVYGGTGQANDLKEALEQIKDHATAAGHRGDIDVWTGKDHKKTKDWQLLDRPFSPDGRDYPKDDEDEDTVDGYGLWIGGYLAEVDEDLYALDRPSDEQWEIVELLNVDKELWDQLYDFGSGNKGGHFSDGFEAGDAVHRDNMGSVVEESEPPFTVYDSTGGVDSSYYDKESAIAQADNILGHVDDSEGDVIYDRTQPDYDTDAFIIYRQIDGKYNVGANGNHDDSYFVDGLEGAEEELQDYMDSNEPSAPYGWDIWVDAHGSGDYERVTDKWDAKAIRSRIKPMILLFTPDGKYHAKTRDHTEAKEWARGYKGYATDKDGNVIEELDFRHSRKNDFEQAMAAGKELANKTFDPIKGAISKEEAKNECDIWVAENFEQGIWDEELAAAMLKSWELSVGLGTGSGLPGEPRLLEQDDGTFKVGKRKVASLDDEREKIADEIFVYTEWEQAKAGNDWTDVDGWEWTSPGREWERWVFIKDPTDPTGIHSLRQRLVITFKDNDSTEVESVTLDGQDLGRALRDYSIRGLHDTTSSPPHKEETPAKWSCGHKREPGYSKCPTCDAVWGRQVTSQVESLKLYHGSHAQNMDSIMANGLRALNPGGAGYTTKGVYLTSDFAKAARYGVNMNRSETPVVFAVQLQGNENIKNLQYDLFDREDSAWSDDSYDDEGWYENTSWIEEGAQIAGTSFGLSSYASFDLSRSYNDEESLDDANIIDWATDEIASKLEDGEAKREQITAAVTAAYQDMLGHSTDWFDVLEDGTVKLNEDWYHSREQLISPEAVPPESITEIWLRVADWEYPDTHYSEFKEAGIADLPQESRGRIDGVERALSDIVYHSKNTPVHDEDIETWIESFKEFDSEWTEPVELLNAWMNMSEEERLESGDDIRNEFENWQGVGHDEWHQTRVSKPERWGRIR
jgi:hypothetical protein